MLDEGLHLLVGMDVSAFEATRRLILEASGWGLALTAGLSLVVGLWMSARVARRIEAIHETGREIMEGDLSRRVPLDGSGDDFDQLCAYLNRLLERIETLMATVRRVSDDIAHDLRTPLTRLRNQLELIRCSDPLQVEEAVTRAAAAVDELLNTFNALLRIGRIESKRRRSAFARFDVARLVADVAELYEPLVAEKQQCFELGMTEGLFIFGDRDLLFQAVANLVDNAIKYTPQRGRITLSATAAEDHIDVVVSDSGPGIPVALHDKVFQRFYRVEGSRTTVGNGLGLSLVRAVADLHGAAVVLSDNEPGLRVALQLPT